jgi:alcohol dehydrogenase class IV
MEARETGHPALAKYAEAGRLLCGFESASAKDDRRELVRVLETWTRRLRLPPLSFLGVSRNDVERIVANGRGSSMKTNPVRLTDEEIVRVVTARMS